MAKNRGDNRRVCRCCGESYAYATQGSRATRVHCERCVDIPADSRRVMEILRRRVDRLTRQLEKAQA